MEGDNERPSCLSRLFYHLFFQALVAVMTTGTTKCDDRVYPPGRYGSFHSFPCGRPAKEGTKCGIHCESAKKKRRARADEKYEAYRKTVIAIEIDRAVKLLEANGYKVTFLERKIV